jgi:hypothetical protein
VIDLVTFSYFAENATEQRVTNLGERPPPLTKRLAQSRESAARLRERPPRPRGRPAQLGENEDKRREDLPTNTSVYPQNPNR